MFRIGQFAELTGVSAKRLRHYDRIGLFRAIWIDPDNRYRYYSAGQLPELRRIVALIDLGVPLADISELRAEDANLEEALMRRRGELERHRAELERRLAALDIRLHRTGPRDVVILQRRRERWISLREWVAGGDDLAPLFDEAERHAAVHRARAARPPVCVVHDDGPTRKNVELLIPVRRAVPDTDRLRSVTTSPSRVATYLLTGGYEGLGQVVADLRAWTAQMGLTVAGPPWYVYMRFAADAYLSLPTEFLTDQHGELVTEIQLPVR